MNSSGIKRGLAATAVGALAVTGLPFFASSASAAPGDELQFVAAGPTRDSVAANAIGGFVVLKSKGVADLADAQARITAIGSDLTSSPNNANQTVEVNTSQIQFVADDATNTFGGADGYAEIYVPVKVDTATTGATASYALFLDDDDSVAPAGGDGVVQSTEARAQVQQATAGAPATITVDPATQTSPQNVQSGNYVGTVKDSAGRTTQTLATGEDITLVTDADTTVQRITTPPTAESATGADPVVSPGAIAQRGTFTFKARAATLGAHTIGIDGPASVDASVTLNVSKAVTGLTAADVDVVTGADTWNGFGDGAFGTPESVRVDQTSIKLDIADNDTTVPAPNANATISVTFTGSGGVTFGGQASTTQTITLDAAAKGSITVTPDAASINENGRVTVSSAGFTGGNIILDFDRATASSVAADAKAYNTKIGQPTTVVVTVKDQFGNPIGAPAQVSLTRSGRAANAGTTARQTVDASGKATFTLPDAGTAAGTETLAINLFDDQFDATATTTNNAAVINYTATGTGPDFAVTGATADPAATVITPLYDSNAGAGDSVLVGVDGGTNNGTATISVDGGALLLASGETNLTQGSASETIALDNNGDGQVRVVGTKVGDVTVTIVSGGVTKTAKVRIAAPTDPAVRAATARNVELEGPESANANDVVTFTATVTDAFGNVVPGVTGLVPLLTGPAEILSTSGASNAAGEVTYQVQLTNSANSPVTLTVRGTGGQFGASANYLTDADDNATPPAAPNAPGLTASAASDSVTIEDVQNLDELEQAVEDAQAKVDAAQDNLDAANDDLTVAKAEKKVAQKAVKAAKKDLKQAKKKGKGVKAAKAALRDAKGDLTVANAKTNAAKAKVARAEERLAAAQAELEAAEQELEDAQNEG